jgi:phosphate transport system permease protein
MSDVMTERRPLAEQPGGSPAPVSLKQPRLPRWTPPAIALVAAGLGIGIGVIGGLDSRIQWGLIAALLFIFGTYALAAGVEGARQAKDRLATSLVWIAFLLSVVPLVSLLWETAARGSKVLDGYFLSHSMGTLPDAMAGGGIYHAIIGTLEQVGLATLIAAPLGLLTAIYLVEYGKGKLAKVVTFFVDVMTGIPSIVAGLFVLSVWILILGFGPSGFAGAMALAILMMPVVVRSTEEMLKLVPNELREASYALGVPKWKTIARIVLPTAASGIITGILLGFARVIGETAPLIILAPYTAFINTNLFSGNIAALPTLIYTNFGANIPAQNDRMWAAALTLIIIVLLLNLAGRFIARFSAVRR